MIRKFAFFLPQFHRIKENDEWWGEGFTEWTNVKAATPLFNGHRQPQVPLNNNYYNLLDKSTVEWQTNLMKEHNVDGLIYYHYYFKGKMLLQKPAENLLEWEDIQQPFFFCWANHTWRRTWNGEQTILMKQEYGNEADWNFHFDYLLNFFKDERYEKKNNKPLFMIFDLSSIDKKMLRFFDKKCKEQGFDGICIIETMNGFPEKVEEENDFEKLSFVREPVSAQFLYDGNNRWALSRIYRKATRVLSKKLKIGIPIRFYDGHKLYKKMIEKYRFNSKMIPGLSFSWDNTPRHGERGYIITPPKKQDFFNYMDKIKDCDYVFINAWNEWCEGMILEPTEQDGYKYLQWIKEWSKMNY